MLKKYGSNFSRNGPLFAKSTAVKDNADVEPRFCIEGLGLEFDSLIVNKVGETILFEPTSFDKYFATGRRPEMWLGHDKDRVVGSNVELCILDEGIAFRFQLPDTARGTDVKDMVLSGEQTSISVGFTQLSAHDEVHFGHTVTHIDEAEIREVSVVPVGACENAFVRLIDANHEPPLHESVNSPMFRIEHDLHHVKMIRDKIEIGTERRLAVLESKQARPTFRPITLDQSNRWQTEKTERLQANARARMRM
jgi:HK97 family phage prohead protease